MGVSSSAFLRMGLRVKEAEFFLFPRFKRDVFLDVESGFGVDKGSSCFLDGAGGEALFIKMYSDPDMMRHVMETVGAALYERLKGG